MRQGFSDFGSLVKWRLTLAVAAAAVAGYLLAAPHADVGAWLAGVGVWAVAAGAACLNNWQDRRADAGPARTRGRPLPAGRVAAAAALALAAALLAAGGGVLLAGPFPPAAPAAAVAAVLCYNALYTPLKPRTLLALAPGIVCGALPPLVGWLAGGGGWRHPAVWSLMTVFALWQPPHLWLIVLAHPADYRPGGLPSMLMLFARNQLNRLLFAWVAALGVSLLALALACGVRSTPARATIVADAVALTGLFAWQLLFRRAPPPYRLLFVWLNLAALVGVAAAVAG